MAHFVEEMKCLRDEIEKGYEARNQLMHDVRDFTNSVRSDVSELMDRFAKSRVKTAKKMAGERQEFILNLQENVQNLQSNTKKFRDDFAKELQEARQGWFSGHGSSSEHHTKSEYHTKNKKTKSAKKKK